MSSSQDPNEGVPVINYIAGEMNRNARSPDAVKMRALNTVSASTCIAEWQRQSLIRRLLTSSGPQMCVDMEISSGSAALLLWAQLVRQNGVWDHKPVIRKTFHPRGPGEQVWHRLGAWEYYYDIWSNIHYGYVGRASGFSASTLLSGAGLEQIGSDILRKGRAHHRPGVPGLPGFDDPSDQAAIRIGVTLYGSTPNVVTSAQIRSAVESATALERHLAALNSPRALRSAT